MPRPDFARAAVAGLLAGLAAGAVMNGFQAAWTAASGDGPSDEEPTTTKAADALSVAVTGTPLPDRFRAAADPAVHYATAAALGLAYALAAEAEWPVTAGFGAAYGLGTAAALDEGLVPALGLAPTPAETPPSVHAYSATSHLVFGLALEATRRTLRGRLRAAARDLPHRSMSCYTRGHADDQQRDGAPRRARHPRPRERRDPAACPGRADRA